MNKKRVCFISMNQIPTLFDSVMVNCYKITPIKHNWTTVELTPLLSKPEQRVTTLEPGFGANLSPETREYFISFFRRAIIGNSKNIVSSHNAPCFAERWHKQPRYHNKLGPAELRFVIVFSEAMWSQRTTLFITVTSNHWIEFCEDRFNRNNGSRPDDAELLSLVFN